jgi:hypothetical protein
VVVADEIDADRDVPSSRRRHRDRVPGVGDGERDEGGFGDATAAARGGGWGEEARRERGARGLRRPLERGEGGGLGAGVGVGGGGGGGGGREAAPEAAEAAEAVEGAEEPAGRGGAGRRGRAWDAEAEREGGREGRG